eukprot:6482682-Amphidinium_carterae.4
MVILLSTYITGCYYGEAPEVGAGFYSDKKSSCLLTKNQRASKNAQEGLEALQQKSRTRLCALAIFGAWALKNESQVLSPPL